MPPHIAFLHSRIRVEEKLLLDAFKGSDCTVSCLDVRQIVMDPQNPGPWEIYDIVMDRCIALNQSTALAPALESLGLPCLNLPAVTRVCGNKIETSLALLRNRVPTLPIRIAASPEAALQAIEEIGYPAVLKPVVGSWGRLLAKINDRDAAEAIIEHKSTLGSTTHQTFYIQPFVEKQNFDIRAFVLGANVICAVRRHSEHWITNTARGATTENCPITEPLRDISLQASQAVGGGILAVDLFEMQDGRLLVNEVNSSMEFRNSIHITGVNIPQLIVEYVVHQCRDQPKPSRTHSEVEKA